MKEKTDSRMISEELKSLIWNEINQSFAVSNNDTISIELINDYISNIQKSYGFGYKLSRKADDNGDVKSILYIDAIYPYDLIYNVRTIRRRIKIENVLIKMKKGN
jgi:hypothetical protein